MKLSLERYSYAPTETEGLLTLPDGRQFHTIERPWLDNEPYASCIPDGVYDLSPYRRQDGTLVPCLTNHEHGVYRNKSDMPAAGGRFAILIHVGNFVDDVVGCIAPGKARAVISGRRAVSSSKVAMEEICQALQDDDENTIDIWPMTGAT